MELFQEKNKLPQKPISKFQMNSFKLSEQIFVDNLEELSKNPLNMVIAECIQDCSFMQNNFIHSFKKKKKYIMSIGVYQGIHYDSYGKKDILKPSNLNFNKIYKPYKGQDLNDKTLLVIRTGGIGDLLFIQPNLIFLKEKYPNSKIIFSCGRQYWSMVKKWECVDEVIELPLEFKYFISADYHAVFEGVIERCRESERVNSYRLFTKWLGLNLPDEKLIPKQNPDEMNKSKVKSILKNEYNLEEGEFIVMQVKASSPIRTPRPELLRKLISKLLDKNYKIVITDSEKVEKSIDDLFIKKIENNNLLNFSKHSKEIGDAISLISLSKGVISIDSSLNHIAASLDKPIFGIFGPFLGELRLDTYKNADWINSKSECSPCFRHGSKPCPHSILGFPICFDNLNLDDLVDKIEKVIK